MIRGTTPTLLFNLPFQTSLISNAEILLKYTDSNKTVLIEKTIDECELGDTTISTVLTQEETLQLPAPTDVKIQLRILTTDGTVMATDIYRVSVKKLLKEGVIE